jgi:hypothetical protein
VPLDPERLLSNASVVEYDASWWDEDPSDERITLREIPVWKDNDDAKME